MTQDTETTPAEEAPPSVPDAPEVAQAAPEAPITTDAPLPIPGGTEPAPEAVPVAPVAPDPITLPGGPLPETREASLALARSLEEGAFARGIEKIPEPELRSLEARIAELQAHAAALEAAAAPVPDPLPAPKLAKGDKGVRVRVLHVNGIEDGKGGCAMPGAILRLPAPLAMMYAANRAVEIAE